jgi:hypothetical protein
VGVNLVDATLNQRVPMLKARFHGIFAVTMRAIAHTKTLDRYA